MSFIKTTKIFVVLAITIALVNIGVPPARVGAQSADTIAAQSAACEDRGGEWDATTSRCIEPVDTSGTCDDFDKSVLGIPTWYKYLDGEIIQGKCKPILNTVNDSLPIGLAVLEAMMTLGGLVAVGMIFVGSFKFIIAQGESGKINEAKNTVINSVVGLVIVIIATRVVSFIAGRLTS